MPRPGDRRPDRWRGAGGGAGIAPLPLHPRGGDFGADQRVSGSTGAGASRRLRKSAIAAAVASGASSIGRWPMPGRITPSDTERKSVVKGTSVSVRVDRGGCRIIKTKNNKQK